jgi:ceroid-lipofuscinosis MFS transporter 7
LSLSAFSFSNLFAGPLFGFIYDRTKAVKTIVLLANLFEIGGNFMYFTALSEWMVVGSRLLTGIGAGAGASIFGYLAQTSSKKDRTAFFSLFMAARQVGMVFGPGMNFFLRYSNFYIGPFIVDKYTAPGAFMVIVWCIVEGMFLLFFYNLPKVRDEEEQPTVQASPQAYGALSNGTAASNGIQNNLDVSSSETAPLLSKPLTTVAPTTPRKMNLKRYSRLVLSELLREHIVVLLAVFTIILFNQTAIETLVVPIGEKFLGWKLKELSIFYMVAGAEIILSFVTVLFLSKKISDRWLIIIGFTSALFSYTWMTATIAGDYNGRNHAFMLSSFIVGGVVLLFGLPMLMVAGSSLFSKLIPQSIQGFGQGVRRSMGSIAAILGPLWASSTYPISLYVTFGVILGLLLIILTMTLLSFKYLKEPRRTDQVQSDHNNQSNPT